MSFKVVTEFENKVKEFFGAHHAVAVDCCTHGIELCLRQQNIKKLILPKRTYLSVPFLAHKLGIELEWEERVNGGHDNSPSLDRIDSTKGYVKGNVMIMSNLANRMKSNSTPEQLKQFSRYYLFNNK